MNDINKAFFFNLGYIYYVCTCFKTQFHETPSIYEIRISLGWKGNVNFLSATGDSAAYFLRSQI